LEGGDDIDIYDDHSREIAYEAAEDEENYFALKVIEDDELDAFICATETRGEARRRDKEAKAQEHYDRIVDPSTCLAVASMRCGCRIHCCLRSRVTASMVQSERIETFRHDTGVGALEQYFTDGIRSTSSRETCHYFGGEAHDRRQSLLPRRCVQVLLRGCAQS
jgi:hypothetical protein